MSLPMELIADEKSRNLTFSRRKQGLKKMLDELTKLCGVDACMIIYGPYGGDNRPMGLDIWPSNPNEVKRIIGRYKLAKKASREYDLSNFFKNPKQSVRDCVKMRSAKTKSKYHVWDSSSFNHASLHQFNEIVDLIDSRMDLVSVWTNLIKERPWRTTTRGGGAPTMIGYAHMPCVHGSIQRNVPQNYTFDQTMMMMLMGEDCRYGSSSTSTNGMYNVYDPRTSSVEYYSPQSMRQPMHHDHFVHPPLIISNASRSMLPTAPSQVNYTFDDQGRLQRGSFDINSRMNPTMMMLMDEDYRYASSSTSSTNGMHNVYPGTSSVGYYCGPPRMQQQPMQDRHYVPRPIISNASQVMLPTAPFQLKDPLVKEDDYDLTELRL